MVFLLSWLGFAVRCTQRLARRAVSTAAAHAYSFVRHGDHCCPTRQKTIEGLAVFSPLGGAQPVDRRACLALSVAGKESLVCTLYKDLGTFAIVESWEWPKVVCRSNREGEKRIILNAG